VIVILETEKNESAKYANPIVSGAFGTPQMGTTIPKLVAVSPAEDVVWADMSYKQLQSEKGLKTAARSVAAIGKGDAEAPEISDFVPFWSITGKEGYRYAGNFEKLEGETLHLKLTNDKTTKVNLSSLTPAAVAYAKKMAGQTSASEKAEEDSAELVHSEESWTNTKGSSLRGTFVSLNGNKITLKLANGKESTFDLSLLSEESQTKAKSYAE